MATTRPPGISTARILCSVLVLTPVGIACKSDPGQTETSSTSGPGTDATTTTTNTTPAEATSTSSASEDSTPTTTADSFPNGDIPSGGSCSLFSQDCQATEKCNAWSSDGGIFPDGAKCVPIMGTKAVGEGCTLEGNFGDGIDNCVEGSICLDIDNSGTATCVAYCQGSMEEPACPDPADRCAFLFEPTVPLCFPSCDPLTQDCAPTDTCVPNIAALGAEFFVCMPQVFTTIPGQYGDACYALSGCDPSYLCIFAENVPNCKGDTYCCSTYCDLDSPDTCAEFDPTLKCVPWFAEGQETPGYESVGICAIMP